MKGLSPRQVLQRATPWYWRLREFQSQARRALLIFRVKAQAALRHANVEIHIAPDVSIGREVRVDIDPGTSNRLVMGSGTRVHEGVTIWLRGGTIELGRSVVLRRRVEMNSSGQLALENEALLSFGVVVHCADSLSIGERTIVGEYSTITDSFHTRTPPGEYILHHVQTKPTRVGRDVWVGAQAIIAAGVTVGDGSFLGGNAVVTRDVESGWLVAGNPATPIRKLEYGERADGADEVDLAD